MLMPAVWRMRGAVTDAARPCKARKVWCCKVLCCWCSGARDRLALLVNREQLVPTLPGVRHGAAMQALPSKASPKPWPGRFGGVTALAVEEPF